MTATSEDLNRLEDRLKSDMNQMETRIYRDIGNLESNLKMFIETKLESKSKSDRIWMLGYMMLSVGASGLPWAKMFAA